MQKDSYFGSYLHFFPSCYVLYFVLFFQITKVQISRKRLMQRKRYKYSIKTLLRLLAFGIHFSVFSFPILCAEFRNEGGKLFKGGCNI